MNKCPICNMDNLEFSIRCTSCGSILQQRVRTLDLFHTIYSLWRYPDYTLRKIVLAEHRNHTILLAVLEAVGISYFFLFFVKAADVYSLELWRLLVIGAGLAVVIFLPAVYFFSILSFLIMRVKKTGVTLKGFLSATIYGLHPIAVSTLIIFPISVAVFGPYAFSNNPSPQVINPLPFYFLGFLDIVCAVAALAFVVQLTRILFGTKIRVTVFAAVFFGVFLLAFGIAKSVLLK